MNDSDLREGLLINNRYELKRYLGSGSFGEVWLAWDNVLRMDLAIKMYISLDQNGQDEFKDEYRVAYGLREEHLLTADYYGVWNHRPFLTMKYCEKGSTAALAGKADEITIWHFLHDVAAGLRHLHGIEPPILHQDIKPENILNDENGRFLITDFGISRKMRSTMRKQSKRSIGSGALAYMGPERFTNDPMAVKASDIWSLGVSAYELATGDLPFMGQGGGMLLGGAQLPDIDRSKFSNQLNEIIKACMAKETWERPTAEQLVEYTDDVLDGSKLTWKKWLKAHKKGGKGTNSRAPMYITLAIIGLVALAAGIYFWLKAPAKPVAYDDEQLIQNRYTEILHVCRSNIRNSNHNSYAFIIDAATELDSLQAMLDRYSFLNDNPDNDLVDIEDEYSEKVNSIYAKYMQAARNLINDGELSTAITYYKIASLVKPESEATDELLRIAHDYNLPAATMIVRSARHSGDEIEITYNGVADKDIPGVNLTYTVTGSGATVSERVTIVIESGADRHLVIKIPQRLQSGEHSLKLVNNNITVYNKSLE